MSAPMNIQEAQAARQKLEQEIARLVLEFAKQTGIAVRYLRDGLPVSADLMAEAGRRLAMAADLHGLDGVEWQPWEDGIVLRGVVRWLNFHNPHWQWDEDSDLVRYIYGD